MYSLNLSIYSLSYFTTEKANLFYQRISRLSILISKFFIASIGNFPRNTQILSVLLACNSSRSSQQEQKSSHPVMATAMTLIAQFVAETKRGCVLEVKTGEGKSTIVALLAAVQVLYNEHYVDIVCSFFV